MPRTYNRRFIKSNSIGSETNDKDSITRCVCGEQHNDGLMIQCEGCRVWQHCSCVNIKTAEACPDVYYCERCRGDTMDSLRRKDEVENKTENEFEGDKNTFRNQEEETSSFRAESLRGEEDNEEKGLEPSKEFTTRRGRKVTKVVYKSSDEDSEPYKRSKVEGLPKTNSERGRKIKPTIDVVEDKKKLRETKAKLKEKDDENLKKKTKDAKYKTRGENNDDVPKRKVKDGRGRKPLSETSRPRVRIYVSSPTPLTIMSSHNKFKHPNPSAFPPEEKEKMEMLPEITNLPSATLSLSHMLSRPPSPPPKPKSISTKMHVKDMVKRATAIQSFVARFQEMYEERKQKNPEDSGFEVSYKMSEALFENVDQFLKKFDKDLE